MKVDLCARPRHTFPVSYDGWESLLSSMEHLKAGGPSLLSFFQKNYVPLMRSFYLYHWARAGVKFYGQNVAHWKMVILQIYSSLIFICISTDGRPLNQRFLMTYSLLIFVCVGCLQQQWKINRKYTTIK